MNRIAALTQRRGSEFTSVVAKRKKREWLLSEVKKIWCSCRCQIRAGAKKFNLHPLSEGNRAGWSSSCF